MIISLFGDGFAYTGNAFEFAEPSASRRAPRPEMVEQRLLTASADPGDFIERRSTKSLGPLGAMRTDGKSVRLVTQPLQEVEHRIARVERERRAAWHEE